MGSDASLWREPGLPRITSVEVSWRQVGTLAVKRLVRASQGGQAEFKTILVRPQIVEGDSCPVPAQCHAGRHEVEAGEEAGKCVSATVAGVLLECLRTEETERTET